MCLMQFYYYKSELAQTDYLKLDGVRLLDFLTDKLVGVEPSPVAGE